MILELPRLLEGIVESLDRAVAPSVNRGQARATLYSCIDLLNNIVAKVDWKRELLDAEVEGVLSALQEARPVLEGVSQELRSAEEIIADIVEVVESYADGSGDRPEARLRCNEVLEKVILTISAADENGSDVLREAVTRTRKLVHGHLSNQVIRDAFYLKPMMLKKISNG